MPTEFKDLPRDVTLAIESKLKKKIYRDVFNPIDANTKSAYRTAIKSQLLPRPAITSLQQAFMDVDLAKDSLLKTCISHVSEFDPKSQSHPNIRGIVPRMKRKMDEVESLLKKMHTDLHDTINFYEVMTKATSQERGEYVIAQLDKRWDGKSLQELTKGKFDAMCEKKFAGDEYSRWGSITIKDRTFSDEFHKINGDAINEFHDMIAAFGAVTLNDEFLAKLETIFERYIIITQKVWTTLGSSHRDRIKRAVASINATLQMSQTTTSKGGGKRKTVVKK